MKSTLLKYGIYSGITIVILFLIAHFFLSKLSFGIQEVIGYLSILIALAFVFLGVKSYRDEKLNGKITFGRALGMGMLIVLIPSILFGLYNAIYCIYINPDFMDEYYTVAVQEVMDSYSGEELTAQLAEMESMKELASSVLFTSFLMFFEVVIIGFIVSLISAVPLRKA